jgi:DNA-binding MarR family transcriptional regulator
VQFVLLATLTYLGAEGAVTQKALADQAATDRMMTSQVLRALEGQGLVERRAHPHDKRARALEVTDAGRALANRAVAAVEACDAEFFAVLEGQGPGATAGFTRALRALARR